MAAPWSVVPLPSQHQHRPLQDQNLRDLHSLTLTRVQLVVAVTIEIPHLGETTQQIHFEGAQQIKAMTQASKEESTSLCDFNVMSAQTQF